MPADLAKVLVCQPGHDLCRHVHTWSSVGRHNVVLQHLLTDNSLWYSVCVSISLGLGSTPALPSGTAGVDATAPPAGTPHAPQLSCDEEEDSSDSGSDPEETSGSDDSSGDLEAHEYIPDQAADDDQAPRSSSSESEESSSDGSSDSNGSSSDSESGSSDPGDSKAQTEESSSDSSEEEEEQPVPAADQAAADPPAADDSSPVVACQFDDEEAAGRDSAAGQAGVEPVHPSAEATTADTGKDSASIVFLHRLSQLSRCVLSQSCLAVEITLLRITPLVISAGTCIWA